MSTTTYVEVPHRGISNEYHNVCCLREKKKMSIFEQVNLG